MEGNQDLIARWARNTGLTEDEARAYYHVSEASRLYAELPDNYDRDVGEWMDHQAAMLRLLMWRVVKREHPEGWMSAQERQERRERAAEDAIVRKSRGED